MTLDKFREILSEQRASGLTQRAYCEQVGMRVHVFAYWIAKLHRSRPADGPAFVQVATERSPSAPWECRLANGRAVMVPQDFEERPLRRLLAVLEG
jgi:hypothetical protein